MRTDRIERDEALDLFRSATQLDLMERANAIRFEKHPAPEVTLVFDTNPNYTNVCTTDCTFCSFYRKPGDAEAYVLSPEQMAEKARSASTLGVTTMLLQGGHNPDLGIEYYLDVIDAVHAAAPEMHLHFFSPPEIEHIAGVSNLDTAEVLQRFWDAGLRTIPGGGAEMLVDRVRRRVSPKKTNANDWLRIMGEAHDIGFRTSATMTYGHLETDEDIIDHLLAIRTLQDRTGGFYAFIPWSFKPGDSPLSRLVPHAQLPSYYIRVIAIARIVLDNVDHIQASWFGEGWRAGQLALHSGADDFGGVLLEENVLFEADHRRASTVDHVLQVIRDAGFTPVQRSTFYERVSYPNDTAAQPDGSPVQPRTRSLKPAPNKETLSCQTL